MALINCKECGKEISDTADSCPHCGYKGYTAEVEQKIDSQSVNLQPEQSVVQDPEQNVVHESEQINSIEHPEVQQTVQTEVIQPVQTVVQPNAQSSVQQPLADQKKPGFLQNKYAKISIIVVLVALIIGIVIATTIYNNIKQKNLPIKVDISMTSYYGYIDDILDELDLDFDLVTMGANCYTGVQKNEFSTEKYGILHTEFRYCKSNETLVFRVYNDEKDQPLRDPEPGELAIFDKYGEKISGGSNNF